MSESPKYELSQLYDAHGNNVTDKTTDIPSGTSLRDAFGSFYVVARPGDSPAPKRILTVETGPRLV